VQWRTQDLSVLEPVYVWVDGIYVKAGLESTKAALPVLIAALGLHPESCSSGTHKEAVR
jgi:hypothetical protein